MKTSRRALLQTITAGSALAAAGLSQAKGAPKFDVEADVVVVGLGAAGAAAAITAADRKASVVAIDRQPLETLRSCADAVVAVHRGEFGAGALVLRAKLPAGIPVERAGIEDIMLYFARGEKL